MKLPFAHYLRGFVDEARSELRSNGGVAIDLDARTVGVMVITCVLLTIYYYYGRPGFFRTPAIEQTIADWLGLTTSPYRTLIPYWGWATASLVIRIAIPVACIIWWLPGSPADHGFRLWKAGHARIYGMLYGVMLPILAAMSFTDSFQDKYPFYDHATDSVAHFLWYEAAYGVQFFSLEAFFRGFVVFALFRKFGYYAVAIMTVPYCMIHFSKPVPETLGAIAAGLALGYLAIQSKSWLPGALLHWGIGVSMDLLVIGQKYLLHG